MIKNAPLLTVIFMDVSKCFPSFWQISVVFPSFILLSKWIILNSINIPVNTANKDWKWKRKEVYILNRLVEEIWVRIYINAQYKEKGNGTQLEDWKEIRRRYSCEGVSLTDRNRAWWMIYCLGIICSTTLLSEMIRFSYFEWKFPKPDMPPMM